jgi:hypothetical protein
VELASNSTADVVSTSGINSLTVYIANHTNDKTVKCDLTATSSLGNKISNPSQNHQTFNSCQNRLMKKPICWNSMYVTVGGGGECENGQKVSADATCMAQQERSTMK